MKDVLDGVQRIDKEQFHWFNDRAKPLARQAKAYVQDLAARVTVVFAIAGSDQPHPNTIIDLERRIADLNQHGEWLDYEILNTSRLYEWTHADFRPKPIDLAITMQRWREEGTPYALVSGSVSVADVAGWHERHRSRLFDLNVRHPLGLTTANKALRQTLIEAPQNFQYFNNGITIVCDTLNVTPRIQSARYNDSVALEAVGASIVNGAQTVKAIVEAMQARPEMAAQARVDVRIIETRNAPPGFAQGVTDATNRQNRIEARDFIALDPIQSELQIEFSEMDLAYVIKRGELPPPDPEDGSTIVDAATALALAHPDFRLAYRVSRSEDVLWERGSEGAYDKLFVDTRPHALRVWRCIQTVREVRRALYRTRDRRESRAADFVELGLNLIAHVVLQQCPADRMDDPVLDWEEEVISNVQPVTEEVVRRAMAIIDQEFAARMSIAAVLGDPDRFALIVPRILTAMRSDTEAPELPLNYRREGHKERKSRSSNAVHVLIDANAIADDTLLTFKAQVRPERKALEPWLATDPRRGLVSWVNDRAKPLRWHADGDQYTPSGLVQHMYDLADGSYAPKANQGTIRWHTESGESLAALAHRIRQQSEVSSESDDADD